MNEVSGIYLASSVPFIEKRKVLWGLLLSEVPSMWKNYHMTAVWHRSKAVNLHEHDESHKEGASLS